MIQSAVFKELQRELQKELQAEAQAAGLAEGRAAGRAEGRLEAERRLCLALARKHHPVAFDQAQPLIEACQDPDRLEQWALAASDLADADFLRLLEA